jgi:hypothetical protein
VSAISLDIVRAMGETDRLVLAIEIAAEHVTYRLSQGECGLSIARAILGQKWCGSFMPSRGQLIEIYARAWLELGVG